VASEVPADPSSLDALFRPKSVAIVGASSDANKIGGRPLAFLLKAGYAGAIHPVNPAAEVQGVKSWPSLADIPGELGQAIIALPAQHVPAAVTACAARGVKAVQVFSAGFADADSDASGQGRRVQDALVATARAANMRLLGPNSLGVFNVSGCFYGTFSTALDGAWPRAGSVGFATQSGAFGSYAYALAQARGLGFSSFVATGNEADVDVADAIAWFARDPDTRVIVATFEGCRDGRKLMAALDAARRAGKPVVVMKAGASEAGAAAAATHTGSLAGADAVYDGVFRQCGAHRAQSLDELVDVAYGAAAGVFPASRRLGVVTTSGGIGVLIADAASARGLELPPLADAGIAAVKSLLPLAGASNPLDTSAALINDLSLYAGALGILLEHAEADSVLGYLAHVGRNPRHWGQLREKLFALRAAHPSRCFALCMLAEPAVRAEAEAAGFLVFEEPTRAVSTLAALASLGEAFARADDAPPPGKRIDLPSPPLDEAASKAVLAAAGVSVPREQVARNAQEATTAAASLGFPVVLKVLSPDITHKTEVGGVALNLATAAEVTTAWDAMMARVRAARPDARIEGALVTRQLRGGVETILGVNRDPVFGPVVMFGLGGTLVEVLRDVAFRAAPFSERTARELIAQTLASRVLAGVRGAPPADIAHLARTLASLSAFAAANADCITGMDVNPYVALADGGMALDALVFLEEEKT
jgi:acyl-CoA synthetase (NDP forming)